MAKLEDHKMTIMWKTREGMGEFVKSEKRRVLVPTVYPLDTADRIRTSYPAPIEQLPELAFGIFYLFDYHHLTPTPIQLREDAAAASSTLPIWDLLCSESAGVATRYRHFKLAALATTT